MLELVAGVLLAAGLVYFVLGPVLRPAAALDSRDEGGARGWDEGEDPDDDLSPRAVALRALKEIEFDRATGKLSDADYDALKQKYTAEALVALRAERGTLTPGACPLHGARPESDAEFCSDCGRRLGSAPGYCARCGASLEIAAQYCHTCGTRVAA
ncbi:MAG: hypothetical protein AUI88_00025 [Gemmatimonadetes bacterium 13_1_40CM_3_70_8]|nr:MAG: hypothetical protein AUI88_00025 [Gemmatimonadetes bacterium 13_1_40CM_3_70_8]